MKCPTMEERGLVKSTSSRKIGHQVKEGVVILEQKTLTQTCSYLKELQGQNGEEPAGKEFQ